MFFIAFVFENTSIIALREFVQTCCGSKNYSLNVTAVSCLTYL